MSRRIALFDLQFLKFTYQHSAYPSTAGLILAGYHQAQGDTVFLLDTVPAFRAYDIVYIIKDDWDLYHDPSWLREDNVVMVGRFWETGLATWEDEWAEYPPDMSPYRSWAERWKKRYPLFKMERIEWFWYKPVLLKTPSRILNPEGDKILLIDYDLHTLDADYSTLKELNIKTIRMLQPLDITHNTECAFQFLKQSNVRRSLWITMDRDLPQEEFERIISAWKKYKLGRTVRIKVWVTNQSGWETEIEKTLIFLAQWREKAGKRIFIEPVDIYSFTHPQALIFLRRWTGRDMGYAYNSLLDYWIYDSCQNNNHKILRFLGDPYEYTAKSKRRNSQKLPQLIGFIETYPELAKIISTPVNGKGV